MWLWSITASVKDATLVCEVAAVSVDAEGCGSLLQLSSPVAVSPPLGCRSVFWEHPVPVTLGAGVVLEGRPTGEYRGFLGVSYSGGGRLGGVSLMLE